MFSFFSSSSSHQLPIRPELIHMSLNNGYLADDDYLGYSYNTLLDIVTEIPSNNNNLNGLLLENLNDILNPSYNEIEHGFCRLNDWSWYFVGKTNLRNCNGEMFDWWYSHCDSLERFKWCHPVDNIDGGEYDPSFYAVQPEDRLPGHYIGHSFSGKRMINGVKQRFHIDYVNPIDYLDTSKFSQAGITACITGQLYVVDKDLGEIFFGHIVHVVKDKGVGCNELVTRMWLGNIDKEGPGFPPASLVKYIANTPLYRYFSMPASWARHQWIHMLQEMGCIANLLPKFYPVELKNLQFRKENFPNGLVVDEAKNRLRNLEIENPYLREQLFPQSAQYPSYSSNNFREMDPSEIKSDSLPRPLTIQTDFDLRNNNNNNGEILDDFYNDNGLNNDTNDTLPMKGNRNSSLRSRQLHQSANKSGDSKSDNNNNNNNYDDDDDDDGSDINLDIDTEQKQQEQQNQLGRNQAIITHPTNDLDGGYAI